MAFLLANGMLRNLHGHGCISDQQWLDTMTQTHETASRLPGPDLFIEQKMSWMPLYNMIHLSSQMLVDRIKPTPGNVCTQLAYGPLSFKGSADFCTSLFDGDTLATNEDLERIRHALETRASQETGTPRSGQAPSMTPNR